MSIVTFRLAKDLKKRMDRLRYINWSELLRSYVQRVVEREEATMSSAKDLSRLKAASRDIDELRRMSSPGWRGAEAVIQWRRLRR